MGEHPDDLDEVRRRLHQLVEERLLIGLDQTDQAEWDRLTCREAELLGRQVRRQ